MGHHELISATVVAAGAVFFSIVERFYAYSPGQRLLRRHFITDWLWYSIAFGYLTGLVVFKWIIPAIDGATGLSHLQLVTGWSVAAQLALFLVTHDLFIYWFHRWMHANKYLWRIHEPHHSPREVDWAAGSRAQVIEALILGTAEFGPMILLGAPAVVVVYKGVIDALWGMYIHSNLNVKTGWLQRIINGPEMHRWHHSRDVYDINFGTKFAIWDWIFRTAYLPKNKPGRYGTEIDWPRNLLTQQLLAFRPFEPATSDAGTTAVDEPAHADELISAELTDQPAVAPGPELQPPVPPGPESLGSLRPRSQP